MNRNLLLRMVNRTRLSVMLVLSIKPYLIRGKKRVKSDVAVMDEILKSIAKINEEAFSEKYNYTNIIDQIGDPAFEDFKDNLFQRKIAAHLFHAETVLESSINEKIKLPKSFLDYVLICLFYGSQMNGYLWASFFEAVKRKEDGGSHKEQSIKVAKQEEIIKKYIKEYNMISTADRSDKTKKDKYVAAVKNEIAKLDKMHGVGLREGTILELTRKILRQNSSPRS